MTVEMSAGVRKLLCIMMNVKLTSMQDSNIDPCIGYGWTSSACLSIAVMVELGVGKSTFIQKLLRLGSDMGHRQESSKHVAELSRETYAAQQSYKLWECEGNYLATSKTSRGTVNELQAMPPHLGPLSLTSACILQCDTEDQVSYRHEKLQRMPNFNPEVITELRRYCKENEDLADGQMEPALVLKRVVPSTGLASSSLPTKAAGHTHCFYRWYRSYDRILCRQMLPTFE